MDQSKKITNKDFVIYLHGFFKRGIILLEVLFYQNLGGLRHANQETNQTSAVGGPGSSFRRGTLGDIRHVSTDKRHTWSHWRYAECDHLNPSRDSRSVLAYHNRDYYRLRNVFHGIPCWLHLLAQRCLERLENRSQYVLSSASKTPTQKLGGGFLVLFQLQVIIDANLPNKFVHVRNKDHGSLICIKCFGNDGDVAKIHVIGWLIENQ